MVVVAKILAPLRDSDQSFYCEYLNPPELLVDNRQDVEQGDFKFHWEPLKAARRVKMPAACIRVILKEEKLKNYI